AASVSKERAKQRDGPSKKPKTMEELPEQVLKDIEAIRERVTDLNKDGRAMKVVENSLQELEKIVMVENEIYQIKKQLQTLPANSVVRKSMEEALAKLESDSMSSQSNSRGPSSSSIKNREYFCAIFY
ncbi:unnamed protein product, partial [Heterosigma akashiwo]